MAASSRRGSVAECPSRDMIVSIRLKEQSKPKKFKIGIDALVRDAVREIMKQSDENADVSSLGLYHCGSSSFLDMDLTLRAALGSSSVGEGKGGVSEMEGVLEMKKKSAVLTIEVADDTKISVKLEHAVTAGEVATQTLNSLIKKKPDMAERFDVEKLHDESWPLGLFFKRRCLWLSNSRPVTVYGVTAYDVLELRKRPKRLHVCLNGPLSCLTIPYYPQTSIGDVTNDLKDRLRPAAASDRVLSHFTLSLFTPKASDKEDIGSEVEDGEEDDVEGEGEPLRLCCGSGDHRQEIESLVAQADDALMDMYVDGMQEEVQRFIRVMREDNAVPHRDSIPAFSTREGSWETPETYRLVGSFGLTIESLVVFDVSPSVAKKAETKTLSKSYVAIDNVEQNAVKTTKYEIDTTVKELVRQHCSLFQINPHQALYGLRQDSFGDSDASWLDTSSTVVDAALLRTIPVFFTTPELDVTHEIAPQEVGEWIDVEVPTWLYEQRLQPQSQHAHQAWGVDIRMGGSSRKVPIASDGTAGGSIFTHETLQLNYTLDTLVLEMKKVLLSECTVSEFLQTGLYFLPDEDSLEEVLMRDESSFSSYCPGPKSRLFLRPRASSSTKRPEVMTVAVPEQFCNGQKDDVAAELDVGEDLAIFARKKSFFGNRADEERVRGDMTVEGAMRVIYQQRGFALSAAETALKQRQVSIQASGIGEQTGTWLNPEAVPIAAGTAPWSKLTVSRRPRLGACETAIRIAVDLDLGKADPFLTALNLGRDEAVEALSVGTWVDRNTSVQEVIDKVHEEMVEQLSCEADFKQLTVKSLGLTLLETRRTEDGETTAEVEMKPRRSVKSYGVREGSTLVLRRKPIKVKVIIHYPEAVKEGQDTPTLQHRSKVGMVVGDEQLRHSTITITDPFTTTAADVVDALVQGEASYRFTDFVKYLRMFRVQDDLWLGQQRTMAEMFVRDGDLFHIKVKPIRMQIRFFDCVSGAPEPLAVAGLAKVNATASPPSALRSLGDGGAPSSSSLSPNSSPSPPAVTRQVSDVTRKRRTTGTMSSRSEKDAVFGQLVDIDIDFTLPLGELIFNQLVGKVTLSRRDTLEVRLLKEADWVRKVMEKKVEGNKKNAMGKWTRSGQRYSIRASVAGVRSEAGNKVKMETTSSEEVVTSNERLGRCLSVKQTLAEQGVEFVDDSNFLESFRLYIYRMKQGYADGDGEDFEDDNLNIWEDSGAKETIRYDMASGYQVVVGGTLNKLVMHLTQERGLDSAFLKTFLLTYPSFTTAEKFLEKLNQRYKVPKPVDMADEEFKNRMEMPIRLRVANVLKNWLEIQGHSLSEEILKAIEKFIKNKLDVDGLSHLSNILHHSLVKVRTGDTKIDVALPSKPPPAPKLPRGYTTRRIKFAEIDEEEVARQLTLISFELFFEIKPTEFLNQSWSKSKLHYRCPNLLALINRFNAESNWVSTMILNVPTLKARAKMMTKLIVIAKRLRTLNNFSSMMAFIAGMNSAAVSRLKWTKREIVKMHTLEELERQMSSELNYKTYRMLLAGAKGEPCIPYLGVHLSDLTFIEEGNPNRVEGTKLINFERRQQIFDVISLVTGFQVWPYNLTPVDHISTLLTDLPTMTEKHLYQLSLTREPRGGPPPDEQSGAAVRMKASVKGITKKKEKMDGIKSGMKSKYSEKVKGIAKKVKEKDEQRKARDSVSPTLTPVRVDDAEEGEQISPSREDSDKWAASVPSNTLSPTDRMSRWETSGIRKSQDFTHHRRSLLLKKVEKGEKAEKAEKADKTDKAEKVADEEGKEETS